MAVGWSWLEIVGGRRSCAAQQNALDPQVEHVGPGTADPTPVGRLPAGTRQSLTAPSLQRDD